VLVALKIYTHVKNSQHSRQAIQVTGSGNVSKKLIGNRRSFYFQRFLFRRRSLLCKVRILKRVLLSRFSQKLVKNIVPINVTTGFFFTTQSIISMNMPSVLLSQLMPTLTLTSPC
jgi:hypothetical protein